MIWERVWPALAWSGALVALFLAASWFGLWFAAPRLAREKLVPIPGTVPPLDALPPGCAFAPRCSHRVAECDAAVPQLRAVNKNHEARCILVP